MDESAAQSDQAILEMVAEGALGRHLGLTREHLDVVAFIAGDLARRGAHDRAVRLFASIVLCDPHHRAAQVGLAAGALEVGQPYVAIQAAAVLIASEPAHPLGYLLSGKGCLMAQEWPEAGEDLRRALELARAAGDGASAAEAERLLVAIPAGSAAVPAAAPVAPAIRFG